MFRVLQHFTTSYDHITTVSYHCESYTWNGGSLVMKVVRPGSNWFGDTVAIHPSRGDIVIDEWEK